MGDTIRKLAWDGLQKVIVMDGDTMIVDAEVDSTYWKEIFKIDFTDSDAVCKIIYRRVEEIHILNGIGTLDT